jgi:hypothetical protein
MRAVALVPSNRLDALWLGSDFSLRIGGFNDPTLAEAQDVPDGTLIGPPVAVASGQDRLAVFGIGPGFSLNHWVYDASVSFGSRWSGPDSLGAGFSSTPAVVSSGNGRIDVFCLGADRGLLHTAWIGSAWAAWQELGGGFTSAPVVLPGASGAFDVFARGFDFLIYHAHWTPGGPADWRRLGGGLLGEPVAASAPAAVRVRNGIMVLVTTSDGTISYAEHDGTVWKPWASLGLAHTATANQDAVTFVSEPVAVALFPQLDRPDIGPAALPGGSPPPALPPSLISQHTRMHVLALGSDNSLWTKTLDHTGWQPAGNWNSLGGSFACAPSVLATGRAKTPIQMPIDTLAMAVPSTDGTVHRWRYDPTPVVNDVGGWTEDQPPRPACRLPSRYTFSVDNVRIDATRSSDSDTDVGVVTLKVGAWSLQSQSFHIGDDLGTGDHELEGRLALTATAELCEPVIFTYTISNNSHSDDDTITGLVIQTVEDHINDWLKGLASKLLPPVLDAILAAGLTWLYDKYVAFAFGGCDGLVAAEAIVYDTGQHVQRQLSGTPPRFEASTRNLAQGTPPDGCNSSSYLIYTSITQV